MTGLGDVFMTLNLGAIAALFGLGMFCIVSRSNLIKMIIGIELLGKAVSLSFVVGGYLNNSVGLSQGIVFTIIAIEAVVAALALALSIVGKDAFGTLNVGEINAKALEEGGADD